MGPTRVTRDSFLWAMSVVYLSAFASIYHQMPGLYGDHGVLPVRSVIPIDSHTRPPQELAQRAAERPSLIWLAPNFGLKVATMAEFLAFLGIVMSFMACVSSRFRDCINFALLWILYFSIYQVGQVFMWFQWDILLLEAGFLCILVAPLGIVHRTLGLNSSWRLPHRPHDEVSLWLVRWLLFRFMFASGVVKLTSGCPTWWGLTALNHHFQSQCIPTPIAWYFHHLPDWILQLGVVFTFVIEIAIPLLFFVPVRPLRIFCFYSQVFLQMMIIATGNYNFFNLLTMTLCLSLVDDEQLLGNARRSSSGKSGHFRPLARTVALAVYCGLVYGTIKLFHLQLDDSWAVRSKVAFNKEKLNQFLRTAVPLMVWVGGASLAYHILMALYRSIVKERSVLSKIFSTLGTIFMGTAAVWVFCISLVPLSELDPGFNRKLWPTIRSWHYKVEPFHLTSSYGLFRIMTGVGGRPELVLEGSDDPNGPWVELPFLYKPGDVNRPPPIIIPHQPRLDWQMWFAALGDYRQNPWLLSLVYRLLNNDASALRLMNLERYPFTRQPPTYIRATLYKYWFTKMDTSSGRAWWYRGSPKEYLPPVHKKQPFLREFLQEHGIPMDAPKTKSTNKFLIYILKHSRKFAEKMSPTLYIWSLISTSLVLNAVRGMF
ncbi:lipase maturation factor 2-like [Dermacentor andersoni]|uniref:lipase maturation factor 2-like n=1 Tax=Dermacentor andersoni TaxID=34620 RepID=UPI002155D79E|nr:lipase maturation factor 2-like [Dermacentor andersoni]